MSKQDLARFLGISMGTVDRMVSSGNSPKYFRVGLFVRFDIADVWEWLEARADKPLSRRTTTDKSKEGN